jgi:sec-independent protein translocase protein TatA
MDLFPPALAFIGDLAGPEMLLVFVIVLVLFGGEKLPDFARGLGKSIREFKKAAAGVEEEFKRALEEDVSQKTALPPPPATFPPYPPAPPAPPTLPAPATTPTEPVAPTASDTEAPAPAALTPAAPKVERPPPDRGLADGLP